MAELPTQREYWNSQVGEEWARQADRTDKMFVALTQAALKALELQPGERVLDIGCGAGETTLTMARQVGPNGHAVGVDISRPLLELGRQRAQANGFDVDFREADAGAADIPGAPFDAAFSRFGVMFFEDAHAAFSHIRSSLRPGGRLVFICWRPFPENVWTYAPLNALTPLLSAPLPPPDENLPGPFFFADPAKTKVTLAASGWSSVSIEPWDGPLIVGADPKDAAAYLLKIGPCARHRRAELGPCRRRATDRQPTSRSTNPIRRLASRRLLDRARHRLRRFRIPAARLALLTSQAFPPISRLSDRSLGLGAR